MCACLASTLQLNKSSNDREEIEQEFFRRLEIAVQMLEEAGWKEKYIQKIGVNVSQARQVTATEGMSAFV
jgi:hypothetical protein